MFAQFVGQAPWWVLVAIYGIYKAAQLLTTLMVRTSKSDMFVRQQRNSFEVRRGKADSEAPTGTKAKPRQALRSVDKPDPASKGPVPGSEQAMA